MSKIIDFYSGGLDTEGRTLEEVLAYSPDEWEGCHDFIQWTFPLPEPSRFSVDAPILSEEDIEIFKANPEIRERVLDSWYKFLSFIGLCEEDGRVCLIPMMEFRQRRYQLPFNHNHFRITRVLRFMTLIDFGDRARGLCEFLRNCPIETMPESCFAYWEKALDPEADFSY